MKFLKSYLILQKREIQPSWFSHKRKCEKVSLVPFFIPALIDLCQLNNHTMQYSFTFSRDRRNHLSFYISNQDYWVSFFPSVFKNQLLEHYKLVKTEIVVIRRNGHIFYFAIFLSFFPPFFPPYQLERFNLTWISSLIKLAAQL